MKPGTQGGPPQFWRVALGLLLPRRQRQLILDDLAEEWARRSGPAGHRAADAWYCDEVLRSILPALGLRLAEQGGAVGRSAVAGRGPVGRLQRYSADLRHAGRRLGRSPGFTAAAALTLAVGIGGSTAIFALIDGVLLRPLPFRESDRLVAILHAAPGLGFAEAALSDGTYAHYRAHNRVFEDMALWQNAIVNLGGEAEPERVDLSLVTPSFLPVLGVRPALGAGFTRDAAGGAQVLLSDGIWRRRYGGDPAIVGRTVDVNGVARRVAGVMPRGFRFPTATTQMWMSLGFAPDELRLGSFYYHGAARLSQGVTPEQASADLRRLVPSLAGAFPDATPERLAQSGLVPRVVRLKDHVVRDVRGTLWLVFGTVVFVLVIACANVANLYLVRSASREREVVVRAALGAGRSDLIVHFLAESVLLAAAGGVLGVLLAVMAVRALLVASPFDLPRLDEVVVGARLIGFALLSSLVAGVAFGLVPAMRGVRTGIAQGLRSAGRALTTSRERQRVQRVLVGIQVALALTLLVGSSLMVQTFIKLRRADPGFDANDLLTFEVVLPFRGYESWEKSSSFQRGLLERLQAIPGVSAAGGIAGLPMTSSDYAGNTPYAVEAFGQTAAAARPQVTYRVVTPGYFEAVRTAIVAGRAPTIADRAADGAPVLVSANLAARLFPGQSAVGQRIRRVRRSRPEGGEGWTTIVGVVADVRADGVARPSPEIVYLPMLDAAVEPGFGAGYLGYVMRTGVPPLSLVPAVRAAVRELDAELPIAQVRTMRDIVAAASARTAFITLLLAAAAAAALFLGMIGIYGVLSYAMGQRRREIGLRMALGARSGQVMRMVLRDGATLTAGGLLAGAAAAALLTRFLQSLLFEVGPNDLSTFLGTAALLLGVALLACAVPALRAAAVQPMEALADE